MQNNNNLTQTQVVTTKKVACNGDAQNSHHPLIYLNLGNNNLATCPYCGKNFILQQK
jgi:uncharacterized Zn-finger protein